MKSMVRRGHPNGSPRKRASKFNPDHYIPRPDLVCQMRAERSIVVPPGFVLQVWQTPLGGEVFVRFVEESAIQQEQKS
jgi:hypothetical protein